MNPQRRRLLIFGGIAAVIGALTAMLVESREACVRERLGFDWLTWSCTGKPPPIMLERDLRRI